MSALRFVRSLAIGLIAASFAGPAAAQPSAVGQWSEVQDWPIQAIHGILLPTNKMLVWQSWQTSALLWDIETGTFTDAQFPSVNAFCSGHAWLPDGRLLVVGGQRPEGNSFGENYADIFDPITETWASQDPNVPDVPPMGLGRWYPSVTTLGNGDVLVMSGDFAPGNVNQLPQVYEYETNTWRDLTNASRALPLYPRTFLAPDGRAVVLSDYGENTAYIDTSGTGQWHFFDQTLDSNLHNYGPAVMYDGGKIAYLGGGHNPTQNVSMLDLNAASPQWTYGADDMAQPRRQNDATILADGTVLITGGTSVTGWNDPAGAISTAEIWDPVTEQVTQVATGSDIYRGYHTTATLLPDGRVLITGGDHDHNGAGPFTSNRNAEIYEPAYLHNGPRPTITGAPDTVAYGQTFFVQTPDASTIDRALMVVPGATTHAQNWTQRANRLDVTEVAGGVEITLTSNPNEAPPGDYMLFLINDQGVPSVAEYFRAADAVPIPGDFDGDGDVDTDDFGVFVSSFQDSPEGGPPFAPGDFDEDGDVDTDDFGVFVSSFQQFPPPAAAVPEPTSAALLSLVALTISRRRPR